MKTKMIFTAIFLTINFFLLSSFLFAQWELQYPIFTDKDLEDVCFVDDLNGWVVGENGTIIHTSDGGNTWSFQNSNTTLRLRSIVFTDMQTGWIVGGDNYPLPGENIILHTSDGGNIWSIQEINNTGRLNSVFFIDSNTGWAVGDDGKLLQTGNGGLSWDSQWAGSSYIDFKEIFMIDSQNGWVTSNNGFYNTTDGGLNWNEYISGDFDAVFFLDHNEGWASRSYPSGMSSSSGMLIHTTDAFTTWDTIYQCYSSGEFASCGFYSIHFKDSNEGWMLNYDCMNFGWGGILWFYNLLKSTDGGNSWEYVELNNESSLIELNALSFTSEGKGSIVLNHGIVYGTSNWGDNWVCLSEGNSITFHSIDFINSLNGWAVGGSNIYSNWNNQKSYILHTSDGGVNWENQISPIVGPLKSVNFCNLYEGYTAGNSNDTTFIIKTINSGEDWYVQMWDTGYSINSIHFINELHGWTVGGYHDINEGVILMTADGGINWEQQTCDTCQTLNSVYFVDANHGWTVGYSIYYTNDGGQNWMEQSYNTSAQLNSVYFIDENIGWSVGTMSSMGIILHTLDGGDNWSYDLVSESLKSIHFIDNENGLISGMYGTILLTSDGGITWEQQESGTDNPLNSICFTGEGEGYAAGGWGTIVHSGSLITTINENPNNKNLLLDLQCFPNPFLGTTSISYTIFQGSTVSIEIYNTASQLIFNKKEGFKLPGKHEVFFESKNIPPGIYFCNLKTNKKNQSIKIIKL